MADDASPISGPEPEAPPPGASRTEKAKRLLWPGGLSARLLVFTVIFVAVAELLILATSLATFEERWLGDRIIRAELTTLTFEAAPEQVITGTMREQLQERAGVVLLAVYTRQQEDGPFMRLLYFRPAEMSTPYNIDLRDQNMLKWLVAPIRTLTSGEGSNVRVTAHTDTYQGPEYLEIVAPDAPLKEELLSFLWRLLGLTILISAGAGALVYFILNTLLVRPMQRITLAMERFRADPDDPLATLPPSGRRDEIGRAEAELDRMQGDLRTALASRARLAALGEAVAKINHDLRNMLTSAQIASERLAESGDPSVAQTLPRLERALDRAARLTTEVLAYGKSQEPRPHPSTVKLQDAVDAAAEDAGLERAGVQLVTNLTARDQVMADPDHLHRILLNLLKNARQALTGGDRHNGVIRVTLTREGGASIISVSDNGPGVPDKALDNLFHPFTGSGRKGGTGLGLAIARELAQSHGGDLVLRQTGADGSVFDVTLPGAPGVKPVVRPTRTPVRD